MPLQGFHWNMHLMLHEIITPFNDPAGTIKLSILTIAVLKDTQFYTDVNENLAYPFSWGKGKGNKFLTYPISIKRLDFKK